MNKLILFLLPLFLLTACSDKTYTVGEDAFCSGLADTDPNPVFCVDANEKPINGIVVEHYENGAVFREMTIRKGRENGIEREYYENGILHVETKVIDGHAYGLGKIYNEDGSLSMEMNWDEDEITQIKMHDQSGNVITLENDL